MDKVLTRRVVSNEEDVNRDPLSGETGAHPIGTGAGAVSGGMAGGVLGAIAGPAGALIGAVVGAVAGGLAGKEAAEAVNPTAEEIHWREYYTQEPYFVADKSYEYYGPGYRTGWEGRALFDGHTFDEVENQLRLAYERVKQRESADWAQARDAARAAWERVDHSWRRAK